MTTQTPSIEEQTQAFVAGPAAAMPTEVMGAFAAEQVSLDAAGVPTGVSAPGAAMPTLGDPLNRNHPLRAEVSFGLGLCRSIACI